MDAFRSYDFRGGRSPLLAVLMVAFLSLAGPPARAQNGGVFFQPLDLPDTVPGEDLWQFTYSLTGLSFLTNQGFSIFFDQSLYAALQNPPPVNADWSLLVVQPDVILRQPGYYDAQARRDLPSLADPFVVSFVWRGLGTPGSQPFDIYDANFQTLFSGRTLLVPEPGVIALAGLGLGALALRRKFRSMKKPSRRD